MTKKDCCFTSENNWFRYRAAAVIIFYYLLKSRCTKKLNSNSYTTTSMGTYKENMYWLPICELKQYKAFPSFFAEELLNMPKMVKHIMTDERK